ncbi:hypothetical protein IE53DRAFT_383444 [Violaceomyces palustris]|uniref:Uncharacterized protein n=1 Tax=Violaceomyces palustris TaxID=1673888 RepID=A0ACD0P7F0_9BASI|nr:hypothetical protein IE53DRAFT_383444 [Violaceomyces palustris]
MSAVPLFLADFHQMWVGSLSLAQWPSESREEGENAWFYFILIGFIFSGIHLEKDASSCRAALQMYSARFSATLYALRMRHIPGLTDQTKQD